MKKHCDSSETMYCSDKLMNTASNRYRLVEQVANRAKRRRYVELDNFEDTAIKPVVRAIYVQNNTKIASEHLML